MGTFNNIYNFVTNAKSTSASGTLDGNGNIDWDKNGETDFIIDHKDQRYIECQKFAVMMKGKIDEETGKTYGELLSSLDQNKPDDLKKIAAIENEIVMNMNEKVHEQFGDYDNDLSKAKEAGTEYKLPSLHDDMRRSNTPSPAHLIEFKSGELICRHYAPLANDLLTQAGMNTVRIDVIQSSISQDDSGKYIADNVIGHTTVMSKTTGNIAEFTRSNSRFAYAHAIKRLTPEEFDAGKTLVTETKNGVVTLMEVQPLIVISESSILKSKQEQLGVIAEEANNNKFTTISELLEIPEPKPTKPAIPEQVKEQAKLAVCENGKVECTGSKQTEALQTPSNQKTAAVGQGL